MASVRRGLDRFTLLFLLTGPLLNLLILSVFYLYRLARESPPGRFLPSLAESINLTAIDFDLSSLFSLFLGLLFTAFFLSTAFLYAFYKFGRSVERRKDAEFRELLGFYRATWCSYIGAILSTLLSALWIGVEVVLGGEWGYLLLIMTPFPYVFYIGGPVVGYLVGDAIFIPPKPKTPGASRDWTGM